ncbi:MAG TPA: metallophosphoesterase [Clostridiales bacterium]|nr:metallophosphoesterase [Clostridiales bacterium]
MSKLKFIVWGDPQVSAIDETRAKNFAAACADVRLGDTKYDATVLVGDITEYGRIDEYQTVAQILNSIGENGGKIFCTTGNHDIRLRRYKKQMMRFNSFLASLDKGVVGEGSHYYFSTRVNGYKFIIMGSDRASFEAMHISKKQIEWIDKQIAEEQGKPVFVFNHQCLKGTNGLPITWGGFGTWRGSVGRQNDKLRPVFEKYKNVYFITGHLHYGMSEYNIEDYGAFKAISAPTVGVSNHGPFKENSQGLIIEVDEKTVTITPRLFAKGKNVEEYIKVFDIE